MKTKLPLSAMIATVVVLVSTVALGEGAPLLIFGPLTFLAAVVVGWQLDRRYLPVFVLVVCFTIMFTSLFNDRADASPGVSPRKAGCVPERQALLPFDYVRRTYVEQRFGVSALPVNANDYVDPTNPHFYPVAYRVCGYDPDTQKVLVYIYRISNDVWQWSFLLNR